MRLIHRKWHQGGVRTLLTLTVNGQNFTFDVDPAMPLLWLLRDQLGLTGAKYGCGIGLCGSCTVHVDGQPRRSCVTTVGSLAGNEITTIEGLSSDGRHLLQRIWQDENVTQCGYCQPGQIMTAVSLLNAIPNPTDAEIDSAMATVLCRCGTYQRIRRAIRRASLEQ